MNKILPNIQELHSFLETPQDVVVISHRNPDGDALGSSLALAGILRKMHHSVTVIMPSEYPTSYSWLKGIEDMKIYDVEPEECKQAVKNSSLICCVDFNGLDRIDKLGSYIHEIKEDKNILLVDHHIDPEPFADVIYSDTAASSTCEMIYKLAQMGDWLKHIDEDIAIALYTGIITDTGSFHHSVTSSVFEVSSKIVGYGFNPEVVHDKIFRNQSEKQLRLLGHSLSNRMEIIPEIKTGLIALSKKDFEQFQIERGDTEGIVNYLLSIKDVQVAALITEQPTIIKLSLRSKGDISVQELARDHFNGGGHKNAAGGAQYGTLDKTVEKFKRVVPFYIGSIKSFKLG